MWPFKSKKEEPKITKRRMHDYRDYTLCWGHNIEAWKTNDGGLTVKCIIFGSSLHTDDVIICGSRGIGDGSPYIISKLTPFGDPPDMYSAELVYWSSKNLVCDGVYLMEVNNEVSNG